ncbi:MAG: MATE family efflux transporter [Phycisphaeraceae bacterium]|nr:MATE family efflux transporter [Phycisphaeraceae bacterium]
MVYPPPWLRVRLGGCVVEQGSENPSSSRAAGTPRGPERALREMLVIALPSIATMASYTAMQFFDRLMVKDIGPEPIYLAAHGNAAIATWTLMTFCIGMISIVNSFVSQNLGAGKAERGSAYAWNAMWIGAGYWLVVMVPAVLVAPWLLRVFGHEQELYELELAYASIAMGGSIFTLLAKAVHNYFFGMHRPGVVMVAAVTGNLANIFLNVLFIFGSDGPPERWPAHEFFAGIAGLLGIPAMGLAGAALATVLGTVIEFSVPMVIFLSGKFARRYGTRAAWRPRIGQMKDIARVGWPAGMMFINELVCWAYLMTFLVGEAGRRAVLHAGGTVAAATEAATMANTAGFAALQWMHLSFMPTVGLSIATQAVVGKAIGEGDPDKAARRAWLGLKLAVGYMGLCAVVFVAFRHELIGLFINPETPATQRDEMLRIGGQVMIAAAVFQVFDAVAIVMSAALRGAGDTVWPGIATVVLSWVSIVGLGHLLMWTSPGLGSIGPWIGASGYIVLLGVILLLRFMSGRWRSIRLTHGSDVLHNLPVDEVAPGPGL